MDHPGHKMKVNGARLYRARFHSISNINIKDIKPGDDYAAINQAVYRRYSGLLKSKKAMPDIIFIDGGLGQLNQSVMVMNSIGIDSIQLGR